MMICDDGLKSLNSWFSLSKDDFQTQKTIVCRENYWKPNSRLLQHRIWPEHPKQRKQDRRMSARTLAQADCKHRPFCCLKDWMDPEWCTMVAGICFFAPRAKNSAAGAPRQLRSWKRTSRLRRCPCSSFTLPRDLGSDAQIQHLSKPRELQHPGLSSWQLAVMEFRVRETPFTPRREKVSAPMSPATSSDEQMGKDKGIMERWTGAYVTRQDSPWLGHPVRVLHLQLHVKFIGQHELFKQ